MTDEERANAWQEFERRYDPPPTDSMGSSQADTQEMVRFMQTKGIPYINVQQNGNVPNNPQGITPQRNNLPQGTTPQRITLPQGTTLQGINPQGINPQGINPQGTTPQGINPQVPPPQRNNPQPPQPQASQSQAQFANIDLSGFPTELRSLLIQLAQQTQSKGAK